MAETSKYALRKRPETYLISEEAARDQVIELLEFYDIDIEKLPGDSGEDGKISPREGFEAALDQLTEYVRRGVVEISGSDTGKLQVRQNLAAADAEPLFYKEINAQAKLAMDRAKGKGYGRLYALAGYLCGLGDAAIIKLPARDLAVVEILGTVFSNA